MRVDLVALHGTAPGRISLSESNVIIPTVSWFPLRAGMVVEVHVCYHCFRGTSSPSVACP